MKKFLSTFNKKWYIINHVGKKKIDTFLNFLDFLVIELSKNDSFY